MYDASSALESESLLCKNGNMTPGSCRASNESLIRDVAYSKDACRSGNFDGWICWSTASIGEVDYALNKLQIVADSVSVH